MAKTIMQAYENATTRIQSKEQALLVASEMLDRIQDGKSYDSFEFIALNNRIREYAKGKQQANEIEHRATQQPQFDYKNQAWLMNGKYIPCGHPNRPACGCYGAIHAGEPIAADAEIE